jgi:hypothetical protein
MTAVMLRTTLALSCAALALLLGVVPPATAQQEVRTQTTTADELLSMYRSGNAVICHFHSVVSWSVGESVCLTVEFRLETVETSSL